ncbi:MAG: hypothetical protein K9K30_08965 [Burkholderiaceae bacterium]|nr:hypothetical protein [Sulfuritalea sp.]MCF8175355.1 hypothetical protein [Burkholderiaceae bacterium]
MQHTGPPISYLIAVAVCGGYVGVFAQQVQFVVLHGAIAALRVFVNRLDQGSNLLLVEPAITKLNMAQGSAYQFVRPPKPDNKQQTARAEPKHIALKIRKHR